MTGPMKQRAHLAQEATHAARKRLIERHADEYESLIAEERVARGLPPERTPQTLDALVERVQELEAEVAALRAEP